ncbi:hypothetical protein YC2023_096896 [Brassica napus]
MNIVQGSDGLQRRWIQPIILLASSVKKNMNRYRTQHIIKFCRRKIMIVFGFLQLDNIFRTGLKGIRMLLFEGVSDSGTLVNTPKD